MAKKIVHQLVDDLDGRDLVDGGETIRFGLDGKMFEIDLSVSNAQQFRDAIAPFLSAARRTSVPSRTSTAARRKSASGLDLNEVREWARSQGHTLSNFGRVPHPILDAYRAAH